MQKIVHKLPLAAAIVSATLLTACGGGGGSDGTTPTTLTGTFKDSNVSGLNYTCGSTSGLTNELGQFNYRSGESCTFSVGNVILGTALGSNIITPTDLSTDDGNVSGTQTTNRVRFLLLLDEDQNPSNGIQITENTRSLAKNWAPVNFSTNGLSTDLLPITQTLGNTKSLPNTTTAQNHFSQTLRCARSGMFVGNYTGADTGKWGMLVSPNGNAIGLGYSNNARTTFSSTTRIVDNKTASFSGTTTLGAVYTGSYQNFNLLSGTSTNNGISVSFSGQRIGSSDQAKYRFVGAYDYGFFTVDTNLDGSSGSGIAYNIYEDKQYPVSFSVNGNSISGTASDGSRFNATISSSCSNNNPLCLTGTISNPNVSQPLSIVGAGCQLN